MERDIDARFTRVAGDAPFPGVLFHVRTSDGRLLDLYGDGESTLGHSVEALRRDPFLWNRALHPEDRDRVLRWNASLDSLAEGTLDYRVISAAGGVHWVRDTCRVREGQGGVVVGILRDVGVERSLREQVKALEARIWRSQRMDSLGALAAGIAHDFNNLLTTILSSVELVDQEESISAESRGDLDLIRQAASRGGRMVRQILRFARRGENFAPESVDLSRTVEDLRAILERALGIERELRVRASPELPSVRCEPAQIEQVILNLVVNARDAMPEGGTVEVRTEHRIVDHSVRTEDRTLPPGEYVMVSVHDTGVGIPEEVRARMFEPFFTTKAGDARSGSGFGLSTVQRIVRGYGGGVVVESAPGQGTTFCIWLPVRDEAATDGLPEVVDPATARSSGHRVLVVEDDPEVREVVTRTLSRDGHAVMAVGNAGEAIRVFDRARPRFCAVVVDLALPDRSGRELIRALRRRAPDLGVVLASGYDASDAGQPSAREVFLPKPFTPEQLRTAVARVVEDEPAGGAGDGSSYHPSAVQ